MRDAVSVPRKVAIWLASGLCVTAAMIWITVVLLFAGIFELCSLITQLPMVFRSIRRKSAVPSAELVVKQPVDPPGNAVLQSKNHAG